MAYDLARFIEQLPTPTTLPPEGEIWFGRYDATVSYDLKTREAWFTGTDPSAIASLEALLAAPAHEPWSGPIVTQDAIVKQSRASYEAQVDRVKEWIASGDVYQVNLSQALTLPLVADVTPWQVYLRLRDQNPAAFGAYLNGPKAPILCNSPEAFLEVDLRDSSRRVSTWPLKGTRARETSPRELINCAKDRAEHVMIVDLERNDLGRIAAPGSVRVAELMALVSHPTVHHLESRIDATPRRGVDLIDILRATFPGGSITGAPKIRAMEIIAELERSPRGVYCGALGMVAWGGETSLWNIPIRTGIICDQSLRIRSGGGIVADSDPAGEYEETLIKARAFTEGLT